MRRGSGNRELRRALEEDGHTVVEAPDGRLALSHFGDDRIDVVISDVFMPGMNGFEFLMSIRDRFPEMRIIMMSGGGNLGKTSVLSTAAKLGAHRVFEKPFDMTEVLEAVNGS